jgi:hypothetical protein
LKFGKLLLNLNKNSKIKVDQLQQTVIIYKCSIPVNAPFVFFQANVVCRQLGFPLGATSVQCCSAYGFVPTNFSYDEVGCSGTESTLDSCPHLNAHDCGTTEGAGVVCRTS